MKALLITIAMAACAACTARSSLLPDSPGPTADARVATLSDVSCNFMHMTVTGTTEVVKHFAYVDGLAFGDAYELEFCGLTVTPAPPNCDGCTNSGDPYPSLVNGGPTVCQHDRSGGVFVGGRLRVDCGSEVIGPTVTTSTYWTSIKIYR